MSNTATRLITLILLLQNQPIKKRSIWLRNLASLYERFTAILRCFTKWASRFTRSEGRMADFR